MRWRVIEYREFHDVPRMIVATNEEGAFLFRSRFDDQLDEYVAHYEVYRLPESALENLSGSWVGLEQRAIGRSADLPLNGLPFVVKRKAS
jgi:hypothetical protein